MKEYSQNTSHTHRHDQSKRDTKHNDGIGFNQNATHLSKHSVLNKKIRINHKALYKSTYHILNMYYINNGQKTSTNVYLCLGLAFHEPMCYINRLKCGTIYS